MANFLLTIQHNGNVFSPPIKEGVQIEWERTGSPGKLTFTTIKVHQTDMSFQEGDPVCFYYDDKLVFKGYVFKKKRDREHHIEVTCYDQIRYLKNKYTYVFENKTATQIITALCDDFSLQTGNMDNTNYVIPAVAEENIAALDIVLDVLEETLLNTGNRFVFYDDVGKLTVKNCANMVSDTLIMNETAENFDYTSSIDDETYNNIVLYYKNDDNSLVLYTASSPSTIKQWGVLRYFEETDTPTVGQNKANALLQLYNNKTRELKVSGAFGDISVRGGTLIPVKLDLGDINTNYYMLVEKVTHNFDKDHHTMDLTLESAWDDKETTDTVSKQFGEVKITKTTAGGTYGGMPIFEVESTETTVESTDRGDNKHYEEPQGPIPLYGPPVTAAAKCEIAIYVTGMNKIKGSSIVVSYYLNRQIKSAIISTNGQRLTADAYCQIMVSVTLPSGGSYNVSRMGPLWDAPLNKATSISNLKTSKVFKISNPHPDTCYDLKVDWKN